jgi:hypothetical protein
MVNASIPLTIFKKDEAHTIFRSAGLNEREIETIYDAAKLSMRTSGPFSRGLIIPLLLASLVIIPELTDILLAKSTLLSSMYVASIFTVAILLKFIDNMSIKVSVARLLSWAVFVVFTVRLTGYRPKGTDRRYDSDLLTSVAKAFKKRLTTRREMRFIAARIAQEMDFVCNRSRSSFASHRNNGYARAIYAYGDRLTDRRYSAQANDASIELIRNLLRVDVTDFPLLQFDTKAPALPNRISITRRLIEISTLPIIVAIITVVFQLISRLLVK